MEGTGCESGENGRVRFCCIRMGVNTSFRGSCDTLPFSLTDKRFNKRFCEKWVPNFNF